MKTVKQELGKVSITGNGLWDIHNSYDRLCLVHDGHFASYISKKEVPSGIELSNLEYWQPVANLRDDIKIDYNTFKEYIQNTVDGIWYYVHHLVPEVSWDSVRAEIQNVVTIMVEDGDFRIGITTVKTYDNLNATDIRKAGNLVYVEDECRYYTCADDGKWYEMPIIYIGNTEPSTNVLWIDPNNNDIPANADKQYEEVKVALKELQDAFGELSKLVTLGIVPAGIHDGTRHVIMNIAEPEKPADSPEDTIESEDIDKPDLSWASASVPAVCCKGGTAAEFRANMQDMIDLELVFYTDQKKFAVYYQGRFYVASGGATTDGSSSSGGDLNIEQLLAMVYESQEFTNGNDNFKVSVDSDEQWRVKKYSEGITKVGTQVTNDVYISHLLCINSLFCGKNAGENPACTHNYVELANGSNSDINLNGIYLLYTDGSKKTSSSVGYIWKSLALKGFIKAGSTFVIRGAKVADEKQAIISVDSYDMEWKDGNNLIEFNQGPASFYLVAGTEWQNNIEADDLNNPWIAGTPRVGYIDSCGFGEGSVGEGSGTFNITEDWSKLIFIRWFTLDPSKQANKAYSSRKTSALMSYINVDTQTTRLGNSIQYYYPDDIKIKYKPMASFLGKTFFSNKTTFRKDKANYINCLFGIQATDNGSGATRCFNWVSVGNYDEFVEIRKKGTTDWTKYYSITRNNKANTSAINKFIEHYARLRWCASDGTWVTTHKCIVPKLTKGEYEYRIGRDDDNNYYSDIFTFTVLTNSDVANFSFIHVTDQQGFNWAEYTAWWKAADRIKEAETNFDFLINTGDITQSGNRANEWLDYYTGKQRLLDKCEMFTIGNNDLCGHDSTKLTDGEDATSKYSHINVLRYFCFELDERNEHSIVWDGEARQIYSLYSFNYGDYHFVSLNSEIAIATSKMYKDWISNTYKGDQTFAQKANAFIEDWFKKDLQLWKGNTAEPTNCGKCIVYMHEMPFTIVTYDFMKGSAARVGSHLNTLNERGLYRFSRLFKKYGIRLVCGGHKHTYCITKPIYDAPDGYINANNKPSSSVDLLSQFGTNDANATAMSRIPVIQVTKASDVKTSQFARYEVVDKIDAPTYVMSQASGYKLVSNKEMPSGPEYRIPWLLAYFAAATSASSPKENVAQHKPMYIRYDLTPTGIKVTANQVENVWNVNIDKNSSSFDMNNQMQNISNTKMTLTTTTNEDKSAYNITTVESLNITL